jgi:Peptidase family S41
VCPKSFPHGAEKTLWKVKGSRALIIDLGGNPGGQIEDLQRFAGYLESSDTELYTEVARDKTQKIMAKPRQPSFSDVPLVVLVDSESASSSEMLARHLQLSGRAVDDARFGEPEVRDGKIAMTPVGAAPKTRPEPPASATATLPAADGAPSKPTQPESTESHNVAGVVEVNFPNFAIAQPKSCSRLCSSSKA